MFLYRFDNYETSKEVPIFSIKKSKGLKYYDFSFLNYDTVLAMTSVKPKQVWIYDTLMNLKNGLV